MGQEDLSKENWIIGTADGRALRVVMPHHVRQRLIETCFRGARLPLAGNLRWERLSTLLGKPSNRDQFVENCARLLRDNASEQFSGRFTFQTERDVGWATSIPIGDVSPDVLEAYSPRGTWTAKRVKPSATHVLAPVTKDITFGCDFDRSPKDEIIVAIGTIYPGPNMGELVGDVTERTGRVLFDFNHPGDPSNVNALAERTVPDHRYRGARK